ncbi:hypothetical protein MMC19_007754, partial [Ptychographa xylographoides]|nr:hypothetical protein [Ptychographa xylographoides]
MIHLRREEGKAGAEEGADHAVGGHGAVAHVQVHVDEVGDAGDEDEEHAGADDDAGHHHRRPRDVGRRRPREPEQPERDQHGPADHEREPVFRLDRAVVRGYLARERGPRVNDRDADREADTDVEAEEWESAEPGCPSALLAEYDGVGGEEEVDDAVDECLEDGDQDEDGL